MGGTQQLSTLRVHWSKVQKESQLQQTSPGMGHLCHRSIPEPVTKVSEMKVTPQGILWSCPTPFRVYCQERGWGTLLSSHMVMANMSCVLGMLQTLLYLFEVYNLLIFVVRPSCRFNYCHHYTEDEGIRTVMWLA